MKPSLFLAAAATSLLLSCLTFAQEAPEQPTKTLFSSVGKPFQRIKTLGLFVAPEVQLSQVAGSLTPMVGGSGMFLINEKWAVGASGYTTMNDGFAPSNLINGERLQVHYGGGRVEYTVHPSRVFHVSVPVLFGGGVAQVRTANPLGQFPDEHEGRDGRGGADGPSFFVVQPGLNLEVNVVRYLKIFAAASYRIVAGISEEATVYSPVSTLTNAQLSGVNIGLGLKAGLFDYPLHRKKKTARVQSN